MPMLIGLKYYFDRRKIQIVKNTAIQITRKLRVRLNDSNW